jgi:hypothetical protein
MKLQVAEEILAKADRCLKNYQCISGNATSCSEAKPQLMGKQRFLCYGQEPCAYKIPFGNNFFCTCPVRAEAFRQTGM